MATLYGPSKKIVDEGAFVDILATLIMRSEHYVTVEHCSILLPYIYNLLSSTNDEYDARQCK